MPNETFEHDPNFESHTDPYAVENEQVTETEVNRITERDNLIRQIRTMESIFIRNPDDSVNIDRTKEERMKRIEESELDKVSEFDSNYRIVEDDLGLPVLEVK